MAILISLSKYLKIFYLNSISRKFPLVWNACVSIYVHINSYMYEFTNTHIYIYMFQSSSDSSEENGDGDSSEEEEEEEVRNFCRIFQNKPGSTKTNRKLVYCSLDLANKPLPVYQLPTVFYFGQGDYLNQNKLK